MITIQLLYRIINQYYEPSVLTRSRFIDHNFTLMSRQDTVIWRPLAWLARSIPVEAPYDVPLEGGSHEGVVTNQQ